MQIEGWKAHGARHPLLPFYYPFTDGLQWSLMSVFSEQHSTKHCNRLLMFLSNFVPEERGVGASPGARGWSVPSQETGGRPA